MKITWVTFGLGWLAILGVPPFSGFWSKDKVIEAAFVGEGWQPWVLGGAALLGAGITAFYMSRLFFMTFHGEKRWEEDAAPARSPRTMTVPMIVLAVGSAGLGLILGPTGVITNWLAPVVGEHGEEHPVLPVWLIMALTLGLVVVGASYAWGRYGRDLVPEVAPKATAITRAARVDLYQDAVNEGLFMRPGIHLTRGLVFADARGVDGAVGGLAALVGGLSSRLRRLQTGYARSYALTMLTGVVTVLGACGGPVTSPPLAHPAGGRAARGRCRRGRPARGTARLARPIALGRLPPEVVLVVVAGRSFDTRLDEQSSSSRCTPGSRSSVSPTRSASTGSASCSSSCLAPVR